MSRRMIIIYAAALFAFAAVVAAASCSIIRDAASTQEVWQ